MARVRSDIQMKKSPTNENKKETHRLHLPTPIVNDHEMYEPNDDDIIEVNNIIDYDEYSNNAGMDSTSEEIDIQSDDNEIEIARDGEHWNSIIDEWITMVQQENRFHNDDDEYIYSSELEIGFELGGRRYILHIHAAQIDLRMS